MGWAAIIAAIMQVFGPLLAEWLQKWLDSLLNKSAARLPTLSSFNTAEAAKGALLDEAISSLPRLAFARRAMLRRMKSMSVNSASDEDVAELRDIAAAAENE